MTLTVFLSLTNKFALSNLAGYKQSHQADCLLRPEPQQQGPASGPDLVSKQDNEESSFQDAELASDPPATLEQAEEQMANLSGTVSSRLTSEQTQVTASFLSHHPLDYALGTRAPHISTACGSKAGLTSLKVHPFRHLSNPIILRHWKQAIIAIGIRLRSLIYSDLHCETYQPEKLMTVCLIQLNVLAGII